MRERERVEVPRHYYNNITSFENLAASWREFLRGKKKRADVEQFSLHITDELWQLHKDLKEKNYRHGGYRAFKINDPKPRDIHKASVLDRLVHHAVYRVLYPHFDTKFIHDSYSCRVDKGTHKAINRFRSFARKVSRNHTRTCWVLKCDIRKFFATIDHDILNAILAKHIQDAETLTLLSEIINIFNTKGAIGKGLPLGNLTSQLLINVYMNEFDQFVKRVLKAKYYIRYADDFVFLHTDRQHLENIVPRIAQFLKMRLKMELHPQKLHIKTVASGVDFLGWVHFPAYRVLRTATKRRMFRKLGEFGSEKTLASYLGLLSHGDTYALTQSFLKNVFNNST